MLDPYATLTKNQRLEQKLSFWKGWAITLMGVLFCVLCFLVAHGWS